MLTEKDKQFLQEGLQLLDDALTKFMEVEDEKEVGKSLSAMVCGLINISEIAYYQLVEDNPS